MKKRNLLAGVLVLAVCLMTATPVLAAPVKANSNSITTEITQNNTNTETETESETESETIEPDVMYAPGLEEAEMKERGAASGTEEAGAASAETGEAAGDTESSAQASDGQEAGIQAAGTEEAGTEETGGQESSTQAAAASPSLGRRVADFALQFVGNRYRYGGTSLTGGTDCSGFTMSVYENFGVSLPHSSRSQRSSGRAVSSLAEAQPGDLICYSGHVALYLGDGRIVHAQNARKGITTSDAAYQRILAIRRVI